MNHEDLCFLSASEIVNAIKTRKISAREVLAAHLERIERVNPKVNAIVTLTAERALEVAGEMDERQASGHPMASLHGLPVAHKDLALTKGVRTTFGSLVLKDFVPDQDALIVERLRDAGAVMVGKTNTPEFGAGSQTFNPVFGATRNPYALDRTCGGSSGGAAVALATGMVPIADGSDLGGSLRNPAAFCNVVGLRPSPGRVPTWPSELPWNPLPVEGPMARNVADCALMLDALTGNDSRAPISLPGPARPFAESLDRDFSGTRIAFSPDFGGQLPFETEVVECVKTALPVLERLGCVADDELPDLADADLPFRLWRAWMMHLVLADTLAKHPDLMKDTLIWNVEAGVGILGPELARAEQQRGRLYHRVRTFMQDHEFLVLPVTQVMPFDVDVPYPREIAGTKMDTYLDWMRSCYYITVTGLPAISVPCGFSPSGLPVGLQIVGRTQDDLGVLQLAHAFEQETGFYRQRPLL
jgi:amidase